ncbi:MAG: Asp-tRNA(Asn)/Glu-tRNA(Gln) amidotransferase subunit GatC [Parcubacteria group bacterium]
MAISKTHIDHLAKLARLDLTEKEKEKYAKQIGEILDYVGKLSELDTKGVEPLAHVVDLKNVTRRDEPSQLSTPEKVLAEVPELKGKLIKVNRIFK